jgi:hypothetical protein
MELNNAQFGHDHPWTFHKTYANRGISQTGNDSDYEFKDKNNAVKNLRRWVNDSRINSSQNSLEHVNTRVIHNGSGWVAETQPRYCNDCVPDKLEQKPARNATPEEISIAKSGLEKSRGNQYSDQGVSNLQAHLSRKHGSEGFRVNVGGVTHDMVTNTVVGKLQITEPPVKVSNKSAKTPPPVTEA